MQGIYGRSNGNSTGHGWGTLSADADDADADTDGVADVILSPQKRKAIKGSTDAKKQW